MSKSLGNTVQPQTVIKASGAEILRLWVSMVNYQEEVRIGKEILDRTIEAYRKIRNTFRYLLSNLYDFTPGTDLVPLAELDAVDRFILSKYARVVAKALPAYDRYDFQAIFQAVNQFMTVDLSAFYLDVTKDRVYTYGAKSHGRRSAQTAMYLIADGLARLIAPILVFTSDEVWRHLPGAQGTSVHTADFPADTTRFIDDALEADWEQLLQTRSVVLRELEGKRAEKVIGSSLAASVSILASGDRAALLRRHHQELPQLLIVSEVNIHEADRGPEATGDAFWAVDVRHAEGEKCPRCWRFVADTVKDGDRAGLCLRCDEAIRG
jgi:isoleucyl-tRNA synthetase